MVPENARLGKYALALFLSVATSAGADVRHRLPALSSVFPQGSRPGATVKAEILGEYLDRPQAVVFPDGFASAKILGGTYTRLALEIAVNADAALGPHYFRVVTPRGASNLLLFRVGDQPHVDEREPNSSAENAQEITLPATVNGRLNVDGDFDFFKFHAKKGESWIFDVRSARNGNGLDPALILLDARGRKLAHSEDVFIWDPFLIHTFPADGEYFAVLQPTHNRNDATFAYQFDIRKAPQLETVSPIAMRPGETVDATLYGVGLSDSSSRLWFSAAGFSGEVREMRGSTAAVRIQVPANAPDGRYELALAGADGRSSTAAFLVDSTPRHKGGNRLEMPVSITGIARYREPERYAFDAKEGEALVFEVRAQRFGSPVDSLVRILDGVGKEIARNDDGDFPGAQFNKDSRISYKFKQAGTYQVEIRNLFKTTGENFPYQLLAGPPRPDVDLMLATDNPYVYQGGDRAKLKVTCTRRDGFDGPVTIQLSGLPEGVTADSLTIPEGENEGEFTLFAKGAIPGSFGQIRVSSVPALSGAAPVRTAWRSQRISSGGGEGAASARVERATVAVAEKPHFSLEALVTAVNLVRGGAAEFVVAIRRADGFRESIRFSIENLPPDVTLNEAVAGPDAAEVKLRLTAGAGARLGRAGRLAILGAVTGGETQEAPRVSLSID